MARLLMLGTVNHPHVEHLAVAMAERGFDVTVGGDSLTALAPSVLPQHGIRVCAAPRRRRGGAIGAGAHVLWIRRLLRELRPQVTHAHWLCGFGFLAASAGAEPLVTMAWGSDVLRASELQTLANRIALRRSALAMGDSLTLLERLVALGAERDKCVLVNWGVDLDIFRPTTAADHDDLRSELGLGPGPVVIGPRALLPVYNPRLLVDAWSELAGERDDVQLVMKHMGVPGEDLNDVPFPDRVHVVGNVDYSRMADYYRVADVCVSIASSDSAPRAVFEAMACGVPCVLSDLPWVHEQIADEREALIVPIERAAVAGAIRRLLDDRGLAAGVVARGRALVERFHDRVPHMDRLAAAYRSLTG